MRQATIRAVQRLAMCAGLCCLGWITLEALDHDAARADDPPAAEQTSDEQPGGLLDLVDDITEPVDDILDEVLPDDSGDDPGRGGDEPADDTPIRDVVEEVVDAITPETPEPADGDDGSPQHPVDTPPASDPTPQPPAGGEPVTPVIDTPAGPGDANELPAHDAGPSVADHVPAPWTTDLVADDTQTGPGGSVCDGQDDRDRADRPGTSARDRLASPRGSVGPGLLPLGAPCNPDQPDAGNSQAPATAPNPPDQSQQVTAARGYDLTADAAGSRRWIGDDTAPAGRLTLWPPGPG